MFHYGGSTHALIFRPRVQLELDLRRQIPEIESNDIPVRAPQSGPDLIPNAQSSAITRNSCNINGDGNMDRQIGT